LDSEAISDVRLALNQIQPLGNTRFMNRVTRAAGERHEARPLFNSLCKLGLSGSIQNDKQYKIE